MYLNYCEIFGKLVPKEDAEIIFSTINNAWILDRHTQREVIYSFVFITP